MRRLTGAIAVVGVCITPLAAAPAQADITVGASCTLDAALAAAIARDTGSSACPGAAASGTNTVVLPTASWYALSPTDVPSGADIAILAEGSSRSEVDGGAPRPLTIEHGATVSLTNLKFAGPSPHHATDGYTGYPGSDSSAGGVGGSGGPGSAGSAGANGGAIDNGGTLTLANVTFSNNRAADGGSGGHGGTAGAGGNSLGAGRPGIGGTGGAGGPGGDGGNGGAIYNSGTLTMTGGSFTNTQAGAGGAGGIGAVGGAGGRGGAGQLDGTGGMGGTGGTAGRGGKGGAIYNTGTATLSGVTFDTALGGNGGAAGAGGAGGTSVGAHADGGSGGAGGSGGSGGSGGAIYSQGTITLTGIWVKHANSGTGGTGGAGGAGGAGVVDNSGGQGAGGAGGAGSPGGDGGSGGMIYDSGALTLSQSLLMDFQTSPTGAGGVGGAGGAGGYSSNDRTNRSGAGGTGGTGGQGASGRALLIASAGMATVTNTTIVANTADAGGDGGAGGGSDRSSDGGTIYDGPGGAGGDGGGGGVAGAVESTTTSANTVLLRNVTIAQNLAGAGGRAGKAGVGHPSASNGENGTTGRVSQIVGTSAGHPVLTNSIVTAYSGTSCRGVDDGAHDIFYAPGDTSCPGSQTDPRLGIIEDNGGPTPTMAILAGSPAIDAIPFDALPTPFCPQTDQRGVARRQDDARSCDIGAFEVGSPPVCADATIHVAYETPVRFITGPCTEATGSTIRYTVDTQGAHGVAAGSYYYPPSYGSPDEPGYAYGPHDGFAGTDTFTIHGYSVDGVAAPITITAIVAGPAAPVLTAVTPASPSSNPTPRVTGTASAGATVSFYATPDCTGAAIASGSAANLAAPGIAVPVTHDATTTLHATLTDQHGGVSGCSSSSVTYTHDGTPPQTTIDAGPTGDTSDAQPSFAFHASEAATFACSIDQGTPDFRPCPEPYAPPLPLGLGAYTFRVRATDTAGNVETGPATRTFSEVVMPPPSSTPTPGSSPSPTPAPSSDPTATPTPEANSTGIGVTPLIPDAVAIDGTAKRSLPTPITHALAGVDLDQALHQPFARTRIVPIATGRVPGASAAGALDRRIDTLRFGVLAELPPSIGPAVYDVAAAIVVQHEVGHKLKTIRLDLPPVAVPAGAMRTPALIPIDATAAAALDAPGTTRAALALFVVKLQSGQLGLEVPLGPPMQDENRAYTAVSKVLTTKHNTVKNSVSNIRLAMISSRASRVRTILRAVGVHAADAATAGRAGAAIIAPLLDHDSLSGTPVVRGFAPCSKCGYPRYPLDGGYRGP